MGYLCIVALIFAGELGIKNYVEKSGMQVKRRKYVRDVFCCGNIITKAPA